MFYSTILFATPVPWLRLLRLVYLCTVHQQCAVCLVANEIYTYYMLYVLWCVLSSPVLSILSAYYIWYLDKYQEIM